MKHKKYKKPRGHYCKVCGERKANEQFSGKGHKAHICKECMRLPIEKRNEMQTITRIENLPFYISKEQKKWLQKKRKDHRKEVREAAEWAYEMRFPKFSPPDSDIQIEDDLDPLSFEEMLDELLDERINGLPPEKQQELYDNDELLDELIDKLIEELIEDLPLEMPVSLGLLDMEDVDYWEDVEDSESDSGIPLGDTIDDLPF